MVTEWVDITCVSTKLTFSKVGMFVGTKIHFADSNPSLISTFSGWVWTVYHCHSFWRNCFVQVCLMFHTFERWQMQGAEAIYTSIYIVTLAVVIITGRCWWIWMMIAVDKWPYNCADIYILRYVDRCWCGFMLKLIVLILMNAEIY